MNWQAFFCAFILLSSPTFCFATDSGWGWVERSQQAVRHYNFDASFVVIKPNQVESFRWVHGVHEGVEIEQLMPLEQAGLEILRRGDKVYYFAPDKSAMATTNHSIKELPGILFQKLAQVQRLYDAVLGGVTQVSGRNVQLVRLTAFDSQRLGYWLWLDVESGFPLKIDTMRQGEEALERWVVTHMLPSEQLPDSLKPAIHAQLPLKIPELPTDHSPTSPLELTWIPEGFHSQPVASIALAGQVIEQWLLSDGLHQVSVFAQPSALLPAQAYRDGAITILVLPKNQLDVTVIGPVSVDVARKIAESVQ